MFFGKSQIITSKAHPKSINGLPLDTILLELKTQKYYMDLDSENDFSLEDDMTTGFREFFIRKVVRNICVMK